MSGGQPPGDIRQVELLNARLAECNALRNDSGVVGIVTRLTLMLQTVPRLERGATS